MFKLLKHILIMCIFLVASLSSDTISDRPDFHAPIGVMADHTHKKGEMMFSYRYMTMSMEKNRNSQNPLSKGEVLTQFMVAPLSMTMDMHMFGGMYAQSDALTWMVMVPYVSKSMKHIKKSDSSIFTREAEGLGDITVSALFQIYNENHSSYHSIVGLSLPVGSINEKDGQASRLPYPMQLGSGTTDIIFGLSHSKLMDTCSTGWQIKSTMRTSDNKYDYQLGSIYDLTWWIAKKLNDNLSASTRLMWKSWDHIHGKDATLNIGMVPTARTDRNGKEGSVSMGANYIFDKGNLKGSRMAVEVGTPVFQQFGGIQLQKSWWLTLGVQKAI